MLLLVDDVKYPNPRSLNKSGREGEIFELNKSQLAKVYFEAERSDVRRRKILALCAAYWHYAEELDLESYAFPLHPAYEQALSYSSIVGFSMPYFQKCAVFEDIRYDISDTKTFPRGEDGSVSLNDQSAVDLVYKLFELVEHLHSARIILGDLNPANFLYDLTTRKPVVVDLDSAQVGLHPCTATYPPYLDPKVEQGAGPTEAGQYYFTSGSDIYGLACLTFEFLVGVSPFKVSHQPPKDVVEAKRLGISSIRCFVEGPAYLGDFGLRFRDDEVNAAIKQRLMELERVDNKIVDFFYRVFRKGERRSLLYALPKQDARHPANIFFVAPGIRRFLREEVARRRGAALARPPRAAPKQPLAIAGTTSAPRRGPVKQPDPPALELYLRQFGLTTE